HAVDTVLAIPGHGTAANFIVAAVQHHTRLRAPGGDAIDQVMAWALEAEPGLPAPVARAAGARRAECAALPSRQISKALAVRGTSSTQAVAQAEEREAITTRVTGFGIADFVAIALDTDRIPVVLRQQQSREQHRLAGVAGDTVAKAGDGRLPG